MKQGLKYLKSQGCQHGDFHSANVMIDKTERAVLIDLEIAKTAPGKYDITNDLWLLKEISEKRS